MSKIEAKRLVEQEPEFRRFAEEVVLAFMLESDGADVVKAIFGFYQIGMTKEQVIDWLRINTSMNQ